MLQTARESASQIKVRAEENAARVMREAHDEANRVRQEAEVEAARHRQDAQSDAEAEVAHRQAAGPRDGAPRRGPIASACSPTSSGAPSSPASTSRSSPTAATGCCRCSSGPGSSRSTSRPSCSASIGPDEFVSFAPTTGPVPLMVPASKLDETQAIETGDDAVRRSDDDRPTGSPTADDADELRATTSRHRRRRRHGRRRPTSRETAEPVAGRDVDGNRAVEPARRPSTADEAAPTGTRRRPPATARDTNVVALFPNRAGGDDEDRPDVDGIFARLRSEAPEPEAEPVADVDRRACVEATAFTRRDEALVPLIVTAARKLKRVLADEQNGVLDTLRRKEPVTSIDALVPALDAHVATYVDAHRRRTAARPRRPAPPSSAPRTPRPCGARSTRRAPSTPPGRSCAATSSAPLRARLERAVADGAGDNEETTKRVRAVYREWKTQHIDDQLDDVFRYAFGGGLAVTAEPGQPMAWTIDPSEAACADCEDNSLAGAVPGRRVVPDRAHVGAGTPRLPLPHLACPPVASPRDAARLRPSTSTIAAPRSPGGRRSSSASSLLIVRRRVRSRALAQFYIDALWHDALGRSDVFWGQVRAKVTLFVMFFSVFLLIAGLNLYFADRAAPQQFPANVHPYVERFHEVFGQRLRFIRYATAVVLAFILALPAVSHWQEWLLFRNSVSFGVRDPQFDVDVGFYVFELPFLSFAIDWLFAALVIVLLLTMAAHLLNGGVLFTSSTPTVRPATRVHFAVLLALLAAVKAGDYWLTRYALTNENRGFVQGATYTVVNAQIPALMLLMLIALLTAGLFLWTIRSNRWRLPIVASALWLVIALVGGLVYPALVQWAVVRPNQGEREAPYIARNVEATRQALGLDKVDRATGAVRVGCRPTTSPTTSNRSSNVRLLNPTQMLSRFTFDRGEKAGLVDRRPRRRPLRARRRHARAGADRRPRARHRQHPQQELAGRAPRVDPWLRTGDGARQPGHHAGPAAVHATSTLDRPELYFSPEISSYAVARTDVAENPCGSGDPYTGTSGVEISGLRSPGGVRARLPRLQPARLGRDQRRLADAVGALGRGPGQEAGAVPALRRRSVPGGRRRRRAVGDRRLHVDVALPVRAADRQHPAQRPDRAAARLELRAQQRQGGRRRLHRRRHVLRRRRHRPDRAGVAVGVPRPVHADRRDARRAA